MNILGVFFIAILLNGGLALKALAEDLGDTLPGKIRDKKTLCEFQPLATDVYILVPCHLRTYLWKKENLIVTTILFQTSDENFFKIGIIKKFDEHNNENVMLVDKNLEGGDLIKIMSVYSKFHKKNVSCVPFLDMRICVSPFDPLFN